MFQYGVASNFSLVQPVPGTPIFDYCVKERQLPPDYNPDKLQWTKANLKNLASELISTDFEGKPKTPCLL